MSEALEGWNDFNVAMVGATAALAGLLIVAMSVNISTIMSSPTLPARAAASIAALVLAIAAGALGLMPGNSVAAYGVEVFVAGLIAGAFQVHAILVIARQERTTEANRIAQGAVGVLPVLAFLAGAVLILAGVTGAGLIAVGVGSVLAIIAAILLAWVVLVELLR